MHELWLGASATQISTKGGLPTHPAAANEPQTLVFTLHCTSGIPVAMDMSKWRARAGEGGGPSHGALIYA